VTGFLQLNYCIIIKIGNTADTENLKLEKLWLPSKGKINKSRTQRELKTHRLKIS
jgi:hypothetical protein